MIKRRRNKRSREIFIYQSPFTFLVNLCMLGNKINFIIICSVLCALLAYIFLPQFQPTTRQFNEIQNNSIALPSDRVHIFYYIWYGNPKSDGEWIHWNHKVCEMHSLSLSKGPSTLACSCK